MVFSFHNLSIKNFFYERLDVRKLSEISEKHFNLKAYLN